MPARPRGAGSRSLRGTRKAYRLRRPQTARCSARIFSARSEARKAAQARENFRTAGLADLIEVRAGDALATLAADLPAQIDLLLLDGAKGLYSSILDLIEPHLREGALVVADNADMAPKFLERIRSPDAPYVSLPFGDDVEVSMFTGRTLPGR